MRLESCESDVGFQYVFFFFNKVFLFLLSLLQEKEAMEAAVRAFEDWEFRVLEQESGIDEEEEESKVGEKNGENEGELEKEISCQQHVVNTAQVNKSLLENFPAAVWHAVLVCGLSTCGCLLWRWLTWH